jgi:hypothetical protein
MMRERSAWPRGARASVRPTVMARGRGGLISGRQGLSRVAGSTSASSEAVRRSEGAFGGDTKTLRVTGSTQSVAGACYSSVVLRACADGTAASGDLLNVYKDQLALLVSLVALAVSVVTSWLNVRVTRRLAEDGTRYERELASSATYQRLHEMLVDPKAASGRRRLFQTHAVNSYPALGEEGWDEINYSLALYDTLGGYMHRGEVDEGVVLSAWHHPLANIAVPVRAFMTHREEQAVRQPWSYLMGLLAKAENYTCTCPPIDGGGGSAVLPALRHSGATGPTAPQVV